LAVSIVVYSVLALAAIVSFWSSLVEATYLTLRPLSLGSPVSSGSSRAAKAMTIVNEKTKLVSVTTLVDTISNVTLASTVGLILSGIFGPIGWIYSTVIGSLVIMTFLYLLPKAIGIENSLRMAILLAPTTSMTLNALSPIAVPLTTVAKSLSRRLVGRPSYTAIDLVDEFEDVILMLERGGHIEPDAGRLIRAALTSSKSDAIDITTPMDDVVSVPSKSTVMEALVIMGKTNHPRIPVFDSEKKTYLGAVTFRTLSKAIGRGLMDVSVLDYMIQPAKVQTSDGVATVMEDMQDAGATIAFVYEGEQMIGMITLSDIIERILGVKV
jgi:magnesium and cobalt exporter, CNNM family